MRLITSLDAATVRPVSLPSAAADRAIQPGQGDPIVGQGLALGVLGLGQGELGVRQFENGADAGVEPALRQAKVLLGGSDQRLGGEDSLLGLLDRNLSLLDVLDDVELSGFHGGPGAFEQSLRLLIPRDPTAAIEEGPVQRQTNCPGLVEVLLGAAVRTLTRDVRQKVAKGLSLSGLGGR